MDLSLEKTIHLAGRPYARKALDQSTPRMSLWKEALQPPFVPLLSYFLASYYLPAQIYLYLHYIKIKVYLKGVYCNVFNN